MSDITELQQQLYSSSQQLGRQEAELSRAEETSTIQREQLVSLIACSWVY